MLGWVKNLVFDSRPGAGPSQEPRLVGAHLEPGFVGGGGRREVFYSPMIRSQSFSETVPLDCELHMCLSVPPTNTLRWNRMARGGLNWVFPFPRPVRL